MVDLALLNVRLELENKKLTSALNKSQRDLSRFERASKKSFDAFRISARQAFGVLSVGALTAATKSALSFADSIDKAAKVTGFSTGALQEWRFAGDQLGVSVNQIDDGFRRFNRRIGEFANSGAGPAAKALDQLNININDIEGNLRPTEQILDDVVSSLADIEDQARRSALEAQLFGDDAGPKLDLLIQQGVSGLRDLRNEARDIGAVLSEEVIQNAVAANDSMAKLASVIKIQLTTALVELAPLLVAAADGLVSGAKAATEFFKSIGLIDEVDLSTPLQRQALDAIAGIEAALDTARSRRVSILTSLFGNPAEEQAEIDKVIASLELQLEAAQGRLLNIIRTGRGGVVDAAEASPSLAAPTGGVVAGAAGAGASTQLIDEQADAMRALEQEAAALTESLRTPFEVASDAIDRYNELFDEALISPDTLARATNEALAQVEAGFDEIPEVAEEAFSEMSVFADQAARNMQSGFADFLFDPFQEDGLNGMLSGFVDTLRRMAAEAAAANIFESLLSFGGSAGSSGLLANLVGLFSGPQKLSSFASGGFIGSNEPAIVGENGPELFIPKTQGQVIPNNQLAGAAGLTVNVNLTGGDLAGAGQSATQVGFDIGRAISLASRRNG